MVRKTFWFIFAIAAALRILAIGRAPLWYDENFTLILARLPFEQMIQATAGDVHPPLWYLLEWALFHLAPSLPVWAIRLPALTFSLLALYTFDQLCKVLHIPPRVRLIAVVMMALMPMQIWYAQEGRMYALLLFLVLYSLYAGLTGKWLYFTLASVAMVYTQNYGIFYLGIIAVVLAIHDWNTNMPRVVGAGIITAWAYTPWFIVITQQMSEIEGRYWIMDAGPGAVLNTIFKQFWASAMLGPGQIPAYFVTFALLIIGVWFVARNWSADYPPMLLTMAFAPIAVAWFASMLWQPVLLFRPLIGVSPFLYLITAEALTRLAPAPSFIKAMTPGTLYAAVFILPLLVLGVGGYYKNIAAMKGEGAVSPMLDALAYVRENWQDGDVIYYTDDGPMVNLMPYAGTLPQYKMPACDERVGYAPVLGSLSDTTRAAFDIPIAHLDDIPHVRAWVFAPRSPLHPECYEQQIAAIAPAGLQVITVDENEYLSSGVWLVSNGQASK